MRMKSTILSFVLILFLASEIIAQYSARESFEYPVGTSLDVVAGTAVDGWGGPWAIDTSNAKNYDLSLVADTGFLYGDLAFEYSYTGNQLISQAPGSWASARYFRPLEKTWPNMKGQYWVSYLFQTSAAPTGSTYYLLKLYSESSERLAIGKGGGGTTFSCGSGWPGGSGNDVSTTICEGGPVWLVTMIELTGDATADAKARTFMWINPDPSTVPDTSIADVKRNSDMSNGFNRVAIEFGGEDVMTLGYDEIRLGTSFEDVSSPISGGNVVVESFNYPAGDLIGVGASLSGWAADPWVDITVPPTSTAIMLVADTALAYDDLNYPVAHSAMHITGVTTGAWSTNRYGRYLAETWPNVKGQYWVSMLMELRNWSTSNSWAGLGLYTDDTEGPLMGKGWGDLVYSYGSGAPGAGEKTTTTWDSGPVWLVGRIDMSGDATPAILHMWVSPDPTGSEPDTAAADARSSRAWDDGFNRVVVHFGGELVGMQISVDEIRLGHSWADIASGVTDVLPNEKELPNQFTLSQNYPNPFNPSTKISYTLKNTGKIRLSIYDLLGREVAVLVNQEQGAGTYEVPFNAIGLSSGIYFYKLQTAGEIITKKMMLLK